MEDGRRKIRICLISIVLAAVVIGLVYYVSNGTQNPPASEGTLIERQEESRHVV